MDLLSFLLNSPELAQTGTAERFASEWAPRHVKKGAVLCHQDEGATGEYILLDGRIVSSILDPDGRGVCVGMYLGPCVVTPLVARSVEGVSLVSLEATTDCLVAEIDGAALTELMLKDEPIRDWANTVLRRELGKKTDREWCLAALRGADRLVWFRDRYAGFEEVFGHTLIASFLGITPVTLSRLRHS